MKLLRDGATLPTYARNEFLLGLPFRCSRLSPDGTRWTGAELGPELVYNRWLNGRLLIRFPGVMHSAQNGLGPHQHTHSPVLSGTPDYVFQSLERNGTFTSQCLSFPSNGGSSYKATFLAVL